MAKILSGSNYGRTHDQWVRNKKKPMAFATHSHLCHCRSKKSRLTSKNGNGRRKADKCNVKKCKSTHAVHLSFSCRCQPPIKPFLHRTSAIDIGRLMRDYVAFLPRMYWYIFNLVGSICILKSRIFLRLFSPLHQIVKSSVL